MPRYRQSVIGLPAPAPESPDGRSLLVQTPFKAEDFTFNESGEIPDIDYLIIRILNRSLDVSTFIVDLTVDGPHLEFDKPSSPGYVSASLPFVTTCESPLLYCLQATVKLAPSVHLSLSRMAVFADGQAQRWRWLRGRKLHIVIYLSSIVGASH